MALVRELARRAPDRAAAETLIDARECGQMIAVFGTAELLGACRDPIACPTLNALLEEGGGEAFAAGEALGRIGEPHTESRLTELLAKTRPLETRRGAAAGLAMLGTDSGAGTIVDACIDGLLSIPDAAWKLAPRIATARLEALLASDDARRQALGSEIARVLIVDGERIDAPRLDAARWAPRIQRLLDSEGTTFFRRSTRAVFEAFVRRASR